MSDSRTKPPDSAHRALALELDAALANDPLVDELAFVPSATLADLFGPNARTHPPGAVVSAAVPGAFALVARGSGIPRRAARVSLEDGGGLEEGDEGAREKAAAARRAFEPSVAAPSSASLRMRCSRRTRLPPPSREEPPPGTSFFGSAHADCFRELHFQRFLKRVCLIHKK